MKITYSKLLKKGACLEGRKIFKKLCPEGFLVTRENIEAAYKTELVDHVWFISKFFDRDVYDNWALKDFFEVGTEEEKEVLIAACVEQGWFE